MKNKRRCDWHQVSIPTVKVNGKPGEDILVGRKCKIRLEDWLEKNHFENGIRKDQWVLETHKINLIKVDGFLHIIDRDQPAIVRRLHSGSKVHTCNPLGERLTRRSIHTY